MIRSSEIWTIIQNRIPRNQQISLDKIYQVIQRHSSLDNEDYQPQSPSSNLPKWKRNVRNVLQYRKSTGEIRWIGEANYLIP